MDLVKETTMLEIHPQRFVTMLFSPFYNAYRFVLTLVLGDVHMEQGWPG
jgi:hypothetical protein